MKEGATQIEDGFGRSLENRIWQQLIVEGERRGTKPGLDLGNLLNNDLNH